MLKAVLNRRTRRLRSYAAAESIGYGGVTFVSRATGLAISTVQRARSELRAGAKVDDLVNVRRRGGGGVEMVSAGASTGRTLGSSCAATWRIEWTLLRTPTRRTERWAPTPPRARGRFRARPFGFWQRRARVSREIVRRTEICASALFAARTRWEASGARGELLNAVAHAVDHFDAWVARTPRVADQASCEDHVHCGRAPRYGAHGVR